MMRAMLTGKTMRIQLQVTKRRRTKLSVEPNE
jgi:hypothetical protein